MATTFLQLPLAPSIFFSHSNHNQYHSLFTATTSSASKYLCSNGRNSERVVVLVGKEETELRVSPENEQVEEEEVEEEEEEPTPEDFEYIGQIKRVLDLLRKNRDMLFSEVKLTIMIEDAGEVERWRLLGIGDPDAPTRDGLAEALEQVEASKKQSTKSLYARVTDTGIDPELAAKRLNFDWDSAAEIEDGDIKDETGVPLAVGYGALYLVTAFLVIIGISVVLILFYNSLQ